MLNHGEQLLINKSPTIWCNARETTLYFYKKNNYQVIGKPFHIENIGMHYTMCKTVL